MSYPAALYDDDTAADVRGLYREFLGDGLAGEAATDTLLAEWAEVLDDPDESSPSGWPAWASSWSDLEALLTSWLGF